MDKVTIISHLTPLEWKLSWNDKVIEDTRENQKQTQQQTCFWGHFINDKDFTICHHKEFEIKGMSFGMYFNGHLEWDEQGSKITGNFGKKWSANLFLIAGAILCILVMVGAPQSSSENSLQIFGVAAVLLVILIIFYFAKPRTGQQRILDELKAISFDDKFHGRDHRHAKTVPSSKKKKKKRSMKEKAAAVAAADAKAEVKTDANDGMIDSEVETEWADSVENVEPSENKETAEVTETVEQED